MVAQITETWEINNRINLYLLNSVEEKFFGDTLAGKGRNVGEQFAHIHNVRLMWLNEAMPEEAEKISKIEKDNITKKILTKSITDSGKAIKLLIEKGFNENRVKGFKPHPAAYLGYIIAHESHHRGQIILALKHSNHPVDKKTLFGLWEWGTK